MKSDLESQSTCAYPLGVTACVGMVRVQAEQDGRFDGLAMGVSRRATQPRQASPAYLGVGYPIHDDHGVDVRLACRPFLENDAGKVWLVIGKAVPKMT